MDNLENDARKEMGPKLILKWSSLGMPFFCYKDLPMAGRAILAAACDLHKDGINLYKVWSNKEIAKMWNISESRWKGIKRQLKDLKLMDYEGNIGDLTPIIVMWEELI